LPLQSLGACQCHSGFNKPDWSKDAVYCCKVVRDDLILCLWIRRKKSFSGCLKDPLHQAPPKDRRNDTGADGLYPD
jgi:hypothetical protein